MSYPDLKNPRQLVKFVLGSAVVLILGSLVSDLFQKPAKTNRAYLREIIEDHQMEKTAKALMVKFRSSPDTKQYSDEDWERIEKGLTECLIRQAQDYEASNDPYLDAPLDRDTPNILAARFLKPCGVP